MSKTIRLIQNYLIYAVPFVLTCMLWGTITPEKKILEDATLIKTITWELLSWNLMLWFAVLIIFLILLLVLPEAREKTIHRLANLKEKDEREEFITGKASKAAYVSTLSLLIFLLFFSVFNLSVSRVSEHEAVNGKRGTVKIGLNFELLDKPQVVAGSNGEVLFETKNIPLSKSALLILVICWQIVVFNMTARKENLIGTSE